MPDAAVERIQLAVDCGVILGTWEWDVAGNRFTGDAGCGRVLSLDFSRGDGWVPLDIVEQSIHPDDWPPIEAVAEPVLAHGGRYSVDYRALQPDGSYRWIQSNGQCRLDAHGQPGRFVGILIDIDVRKRTEERLRESEAAAHAATTMLQAVIDTLPTPIYVKDRQGRMLVANQAVMSLLGKSWDEIYQRTDAEFYDDRELGERIVATDQRLMASGGTEVVEEIVRDDADGPVLYLSHKSAFRNEDGEVVGLVGASFDITARNRVEQALAASEARLRSVLDNLFAFVGIMELDGTLIEANRAPLEGAGVTREQVLGRKVWETYWFDHDPAVMARIRETAERARLGETSRFDLEIRWHGDSRLMIDYQIAPLHNAAGEVVQLIPSGVDITARTRAEAQRETLIRELHHRVKNLFAITCGMVNMTSRTAATPRDMGRSLIDRLTALAQAHDLIHAPAIDHPDADRASLADLVRAVVGPHVSGREQLQLHGNPVLVVPYAATGLALIFHELATNSAKYGALSVPEGVVDIAWRNDGDDMIVQWHERGGPPMTTVPDREGFGRKLMHMTAAGQFGGGITFDWPHTGAHVTLIAKRERIER
jgi:PAS domain S-box-containing protein